MKKYILTVLVVSLSLTGYSTTYYVRSATGSDTNDGLSVSTAFQTLVKMFSGTPVLNDNDVINISGTFDYTQNYTIAKSITIQGTDKSTAIIQGLPQSNRAFTIGPNNIVISVTFENITFRNFDNYHASNATSGGVLFVNTLATLTCRNVIFTDNKCTAGGAVHIQGGAGIFEDCYFYNNRAVWKNSWSNPTGGAINGNYGPYGGSIALTIDRCLFENNRSDDYGSAIRFTSQSTATSGNGFMIRNSTFVGNVITSTSTSSIGSAVRIELPANTQTGSFINNTLAYNTSIVSGASAGLSVGGTANKLQMLNNILYSNTNSTSGSLSVVCAVLLKESRNNITDQNYDFATNTTASMSANNTVNITGANMALASTLTNNGGVTKSLAFTNVNSAAINAGYATGAPTVDQRGISRNTVDVGAYEYVTYRSKASGNWSSAASWQSSGDNTTWTDATIVPASTVAGSISVQNNHLITVAENATSPSLTIQADGQLTLNNGATLGITGNLTLNSDADNGTGTLVDKNTNGGLTVSGTSNVQQYVTSNQTGLNGRNWYIASPLSAAMSSSITTATGNGLVYYAGPSNWPAAGSTLEVMKGYIAISPAQNTTINFVGGNINTGDKSVSNLPLGFNLVGNPYPSSVDFSLATKTNVTNSIWYRSKKTGSYNFHTYNVTGGVSVNDGTAIIAPMQAFWIKTTNATNTFGFTNSMRLHQDQSVVANRLMAPGTNSQKVLRLQINNSVYKDESVIYFNPLAQNTVDDYDTQKMFNNSPEVPEIYTKVDAMNLVINGMNSIPYETEIPLGFVTSSEGNFSIWAPEFKNFEAGTRVLLIDKLNPGVETELSDGKIYNFSSLVTTANTNRFSILFKMPVNSTAISKTNEGITQIFVNDQNQITIIANPGSSYSIFNVVGQQIGGGVTSSNSNNTNIQIRNSGNIQSGIFIVKVNNVSQRVIVK